METELPSELHAKIVALSAVGDQLVGTGAYKDAVARYNEAWALVPEPKSQWSASTWLLAAIGDACFLGGYYKSGAEAFGFALQCPGGFGNPFVHMRLGQCALEWGNESLAAEHLCRAYALDGTQVFKNEPSKYFEFLATKVQPPVEGW